MNVKKTNLTLHRNNINKVKIYLKLDGISISQVVYTNFLWVIINEELTLNDHFKRIDNKVSRCIRIIRKASVNLSTYVMLY